MGQSPIRSSSTKNCRRLSPTEETHSSLYQATALGMLVRVLFYGVHNQSAG